MFPDTCCFRDRVLTFFCYIIVWHTWPMWGMTVLWGKNSSIVCLPSQRKKLGQSQRPQVSQGSATQCFYQWEVDVSQLSFLVGSSGHLKQLEHRRWRCPIDLCWVVQMVNLANKRNYAVAVGRRLLERDGVLHGLGSTWYYLLNGSQAYSVIRSPLTCSVFQVCSANIWYPFILLYAGSERWKHTWLREIQ